MKAKSTIELSMDTPCIIEHINKAFDGDIKKYEEHISEFLKDKVRFLFNASQCKNINVAVSTEIFEETK